MVFMGSEYHLLAVRYSEKYFSFMANTAEN